ncbi:pentapeptide repeat-containing protein [Crocosphaera sp. XPORK-15E]|uniref:pentapeptide repeat-containing protein n=1 Tax=Crocosphaera sp. XPORK-15E TaxID=3110247 RepID=UPI002B20470C|nr:pentapeptide repeat-containing protein [Crocosphaera sp. XPORK-15E]MEA5534524.1 pentapeptide repeat-containing protein [Crocosphaera sp. XPORK-15E]
MANREQLEILKLSVQEWNKWRQDNPHVEIDLSQADLSNLNLNGAILNDADMSDSTLARSKLIQAKLIRANLRKTSLMYTDFQFAILAEANFLGATFINTNFHLANLTQANLESASLIGRVPNQGLDVFRQANIRQANFSRANLHKADLSGQIISDQSFNFANLSDANLARVEALGTNFENATLTGACIEDWHINSDTKFNDVICKYIYRKITGYTTKDYIYLERRPSDETKIFNPGDFQRLIETSRETVDLIFGQGIDWHIFLQSFNQLRDNFPNDDLTVSAIEKKYNGAFIIKVEVPQNSDKSAIEADFWKQYQPLLDAKDAHIKSLESNNNFLQQEIESNRKENTEMLKIIKTLAAKDNSKIINNFQNSKFGGGFSTENYNGNVNNNDNDNSFID